MVRKLLSLVVLGFATAAFAADDKKPAEKTLDEKRSDPVTAIAEALRMAEAKEFKELIKTFAPPEEQKKMKESEIEEFIKMMSSDEGKKMVEELKAVKDVKPVMSDEDKKAVFETKVKDKNVKVTMVKIEKFWYLK